MLFPTLVIDNFFEDPESVLQYANTLKYKAPEDGSYPGTRSENLDNVFFQFVTKKIMAALYPMNYRYMNWAGSQFFQKINGADYPYEGWVHQDYNQEISAIIYLSKDHGCGTAIYTPKDHDREILFVDKKHKQFKEVFQQKGKDDDLEKYLRQNNDRFKKTIEVDSVYNRLLLFDSSAYHGVVNFGKNERTTLITFLSEITSEQPIKYPISQMGRV
jgi:hypothetical protein